MPSNPRGYATAVAVAAVLISTSALTVWGGGLHA